MIQKYFKKTLAGIFAIAIVTSSVPLAPYTKMLDSISITASAASTENGLEYQIVDDSITITGYSGSDTAINIPEMIGGLPVTAIGTNAFYRNTDITSVSMPSVKTIGSRAFAYCEALSAVEIPSVTTIDQSAFEYCMNLSAVEMPSVKTIGSSAFAECAVLSAVEMPSVTTIDQSAFKYCMNLSAVEMPNVTSIGENAFDNSGLTSVVIPEGVTRLEYAVFSGIDNLQFAQIPSSVEYLDKYAFGYGSSISKTLQFAGFPKEGLHNEAFNRSGNITLNVPSESLDDWKAVFGMTDETPDGTTTLGATGKITLNAGYVVNFDMQGNGTSVDYQFVEIGEKAQQPEKPTADGYEFAGWYTDADCTDGNEFDFSQPLTKDIKLYAKWENSILNSDLVWTLDENGVLTITGEDEAFPDCWVNDAAVEWCDKKDEVKEVVFNTPKMKKLGSAAFYEFPLTKITLPSTLTEIGYAAFKHCVKLESLDIPTGVKEIPDSLLEMKQDENYNAISALTSISMASDVTKIGGWAFSNCSYVTSFDGLSESLKVLTSLGEGAFSGMKGIQVSLPTTLDQTSIDRFTFNGTNLGTDLEIPSDITEIGQNAFSWTTLENVIIPSSVSKIDTRAFEGWETLKTITLKGAANSVIIADDAFLSNNKEGMTFYVPASQVDAYKSMKALEGSNVIGQATATFDLGGKGENFTLNTDSETKITKPTDPTADEFIFGGWYTDNTYATEFNFNDALTDDKVTIYAKWEETATVTFDMQGHGTAIDPITVKSGEKIEEPTAPSEDEYIFCGWYDQYLISQIDFNNEIIEDTTFYARWCPISASCGDDLMYKFDEASGELTIYGNGTEMYDYDSDWPNYYGLPIKSIKFETENLKTIGAFAFSRLSDVTDITIPASVTTINDCAFEKCESLSTLTFEGDSVPEFNGEYVFLNCEPDVIYVPETSVDVYTNALNSFELDDKITALTASLKGYSVSYDGTVTINFHYSIPDALKNGYVMFNDTTKAEVPVYQDSSGCYVFSFSMPAKNMYDEITAKFCDANGNAVGETKTFCLAQYTEAIKTNNPNLDGFIDSFLEYGAQAAKYFGVSGAPEAKSYNDDVYADICDKLNAYASTDEMDKSFVGATLLLKSIPKLRLYYSEYFDGAEQNDLNKDLYYTETDVDPVKLGEKFNGYSIYNYIYKAMNCDDADLKDLCVALYNMSDAAAGITIG